MKPLITLHYGDDQKVEIYLDEENMILVKKVEFNKIWKFSGKYSAQYLEYMKNAVIWSGNKIIFFDNRSGFEFEEKDFVGDVIGCNGYFLTVGDNYITKRSASNFSEVSSYFHNEIISQSSCHDNVSIEFEDIGGDSYRYDTRSDKVTPITQG